MNNRFKELAEQAGGNFGEGFEFAVVFGELEDFEYFAELIVRECFTKLKPYLDDQFIDDIESELKEHFGVEE